MKRLIKNLLLALLVIFILIQFFRPAKNAATGIGDNDITKKFPVPQEVATILKVSCYDCHSSNTIYPWYSHIQPVAWWLNNHIVEGKRELNFSDFSGYPVRKQYKKLQEIIDQVKEDEMPLSSYLIIHKNARLNGRQKQVVTNWAQSLRDTLQVTYPPDSLVRRK